MVDVVNKCAYLIEALNNAQPDAKVFRNHCLDISSCTNRLLPLVLKAQEELPTLHEAPGATDALNKLNESMEEALQLLRKCATMSKLDKIMDQGISLVNEQTPSVISGLKKSIFGDRSIPLPATGDTKINLLKILEALQQNTRDVETLINKANPNLSRAGTSSAKSPDAERNRLLS